MGSQGAGRSLSVMKLSCGCCCCCNYFGLFEVSSKAEDYEPHLIARHMKGSKQLSVIKENVGGRPLADVLLCFTIASLALVRVGLGVCTLPTTAIVIFI